MILLTALIHARLALAKDRERGATMVEYSFILGLVALVLIGAVVVIGLDTRGLFVPAL